MSALTAITEEQLADVTAERDAAIALARLRTEERDRARCLAAALESLASEAYRLLWDGIGEQTSHGAQIEWGRRVAAFLRVNAADAGADRLPVPAGWEGP